MASAYLLTDLHTNCGQCLLGTAVCLQALQLLFPTSLLIPAEFCNCDTGVSLEQN